MEHLQIFKKIFILIVCQSNNQFIDKQFQLSNDDDDDDDDYDFVAKL